VLVGTPRRRALTYVTGDYIDRRAYIISGRDRHATLPSRSAVHIGGNDVTFLYDKRKYATLVCVLSYRSSAVSVFFCSTIVNYYSGAICAIFNVAGINIQHGTGATNACPSTT